ncbi:dolichyl-phosphate beta-D-mannosyltransferase related protein [Methanosarcina sp. WWM596]|nr:dolichyl-phosphate beta-D-mannosyltransferase related protein [Methanosarcina sp. WWM596]AKB21009.1 dolichyl-phosphate beta-D-mannosyltransferase related protein [Methanosarcina sp. WH1]
MLITRRYTDRVIVVNNGISDQCVELVEFAGAEGIRDFTYMNKNFSLKKGIEAAKDADILVTMDGCL